MRSRSVSSGNAEKFEQRESIILRHVSNSRENCEKRLRAACLIRSAFFRVSLCSRE